MQEIEGNSSMKDPHKTYFPQAQSISDGEGTAPNVNEIVVCTVGLRRGR